MTAIIESPPVREITAHELWQAGPGHGVAIITATIDGWIMAVCPCALIGYGIDDGEAVKNLRYAHNRDGLRDTT